MLSSFKRRSSLDKPSLFNGSINTTYAHSNSLEAWWLFNEGGGLVLQDSIKKNHGTIGSGCTWKQGRSVGSALFFQNAVAGSVVTVPWPMRPDLTTTINNGTVTFSAWVNFSDNAPSEMGIVGVGSSGLGGLNLAALAGLGFSFWFSGAGNSIINTGIVPTIGLWYHVVGVTNGFNITIYINGVSKGTGSDGSFVGLTPINNVLVIGNEGQNDDTSRGFPGLIDDVRIYSTALSETQVRELYENSYANLVRRGRLSTVIIRKWFLGAR